jgi:hypothetical protein
MSKLWEIRQTDDHPRYGHRYGMRKDDVEEAYECGFEDGYEKAMKEVYYNERRGR